MSIVYGIHAVAEALNAGNVEKVCIERGQRNPRIREISALCRRKGVQVSLEVRAWLDCKADGERHQGILCYVSELPAVSVEEVISKAASPGLLLLLDGIEDPHNLGAVLRSAEVAGADGVFLPQRRSAQLSAAAAKASAGAVSHLRIARCGNTAQLLERLKTAGYWITGFDSGATTPLWDVDLTVPVVLVLGSEVSGMHRLLREKCDFLASIPMRGKVSSYNVSVAAGIALYEVLRQRRAGNTGPGT
jgi:23S rRNA (guanosine2251-2'-O)-methyltransferase